MNNGQFNEGSMFDTVENLFEVNLEKFSGITRLAVAVSRFHGFNQQIKLTSGVQKNITTGKTQTKKATQESLLLLANIVRAALFALALELGNVELQKKMELSERQFRALRDPEQFDYAKTILAEALPFEKELEESGVTKAILDDLDAHISGITNAKAKRDHSQLLRTNSTSDLENLFKTTRDYLKKTLDSLMVPFRISDPQFYNEYLLAREIKHLGIRHNKPDAPPAAETEPDPETPAKPDPKADDEPSKKSDEKK